MTLLIAALALVVALVAVAGSGTVIRSLTRQHARERDLLINQLLHATGKPWVEPPAGEATRVARDSELEAERRYTATPEQEPLD